MSDEELSDDMQELNDLIAEYRSKEEDPEDEQQVESSHKNESKGEAPEGEEQDESSHEDDSKGKDYCKISMDTVLFGDKAKFKKNLERATEKKSIYHEDEENKSEKNDRKRKPVWVDPDDEDIQLGEVKLQTKRTGSLEHLKMDKSYKEYLTSRFTRIVNQPKWASLEEKEKNESDDDDEVLRTVGFLNKPAENILTSGILKMKKLKDLNRATYGENRISSIQFHPTSSAALVTGANGVATIYAVDGTQNEKLHNFHIANFSIRCAKLLPCGTKAVFGSTKRYGYLYDLITAKETRYTIMRDFGDLSNFQVSPCGRYLVSEGLGGEIHIFEAKTFEIIRTLKQNDEVSSICFTSDSQRLIVSGKSSNVCIFSMRQQRLEHRFVDDGCIVGSAMDLSPNQRLLATGSREGVVNVYDFDTVMLSSTPQPSKTFLNLTTGIGCVRFNHSSELLAFSSFMCKDAVKIAHFPSGTVYANFPGNMPKFGHVRTLEFSPQSAYFAMGTESKCPLFRIKHFPNY